MPKFHAPDQLHDAAPYFPYRPALTFNDETPTCIKLAVTAALDSSGEPMNVVRCPCTLIELQANSFNLPQAEVQDPFVSFQSNVHDLTVKPTAFFSHPKPPEYPV